MDALRAPPNAAGRADCGISDGAWYVWRKNPPSGCGCKFNWSIQCCTLATFFASAATGGHERLIRSLATSDKCYNNRPIVALASRSRFLSRAREQARFAVFQKILEPDACYDLFPYWPAALPIDGPALAKSCGLIIGRNDTFALNARNQGSASAGISDESVMSKIIEADRWPLSSAKK